jgi:carboxyl-terminal processing protease
MDLRRSFKPEGWVVAALAVLAAACGRGGPVAIKVTPLPTFDPVTRHLAVFDKAWAAVHTQYVRDDFNGLDWEALGDDYRGRVSAGLSEAEFAETMQALLANLPDRQAVFETRQQRLEEETADRRTYHGIGAFISFRDEPEPHVVVLSVIGDSPAEAAGLQSHDSIYAVDGEPFTADDADVPAERIRGDPDSTVVLTVQSPGEPRRDVTIQRQQILAADVLRGGYLDDLGVAYYRVPVAAESTLAQTIAENLLSIGEERPLNGLVIDLRVARSGDGSWPLSQMLTLFGNGELGEYYSRAGADPLAIEGRDLAGSQTVPMVILVGPDTEGSPEIFAAALQSVGRARLIGLPTAGAVEGFTEVPLPDGSRMFLATSSFRTQDNLDLANTGLTPDVAVPSDWDQITSERDPVLAAALTLLLSP